MAKNHLLYAPVRARIDQRVERILRELGSPAPPLRLEDVRELLKLNLSYFSGDDDGLLSSLVSRLKIAGKQVLKRPMLLAEAVKNLNLRALYLPDRRRIMLDDTVPKPKHRWLEAHEIVHDALPWHHSVLLGDDEHTVTPACHAKVEAEANFGAGQLLFFRDRFIEEARSRPFGFESVRKLKPLFGNTLTTTFWRYVELAWAGTPLLGVISHHPHPARRSATFDPAKPCRHFVQSPEFAAKFSRVTESAVFELLTTYCGSQSAGPLGDDEMLLNDDNGERHIFHFATFYNQHDALTLARWLRPARLTSG